MSVYIIAQLKFTRRELYDRYQSRFFRIRRNIRRSRSIAKRAPTPLC